MPIFNNVLTGIQTGIGVLNTIQGQTGGGGNACRSPAGCFQCQMTGQGDIAGCLDALLNGNLYTMLTGGDMRGEIPNNQVLQAFQNGLTAISNPALFKQSDRYLQSAKVALQGYIDRYRGRQQAGTSTTVMVNSNGQTVTVPSGQTAVVSAIPNSYIVGGGVALLALVYFLKR